MGGDKGLLSAANHGAARLTLESDGWQSGRRFESRYVAQMRLPLKSIEAPLEATAGQLLIISRLLLKSV